MGLGTKQAAKMSMSLVGLAGNLASFKNISIDEAKTALNGIYSGETESLKRIGVIMTQANLQQYAYSQGIKKKIKQMTQAEQVMLRYNYVVEKTKNSEGDFMNTKGTSAANQMRIFTESLKELGATFGQVLLPLVIPVLKKINEWIQSFGKLDDKTKKTILIVAGIAAVIPPIIVGIGSLISAFGAIAGVMTAISLPVVGVIAAIAGIGVVMYKLFNTNKEFRASVLTVWNQVKAGVTVVCNFLKAFWKKWGNDIKAYFAVVWKNIGVVFTTAFKVLSAVFKVFVAYFKGDWKGLWNGVKEIFSSCWSGFKAIFKNSFDFIVNLLGKYFPNIKNKFNGFVTFISGIYTKVKGFLSGMFDFQIPKIKLPHFNVTGKFSLNPPSIPSFDVSWYDKGGIFNRPAIIGVGEKRPEVVGALDDLRYMFRNELKRNTVDTGTGININIGSAVIREEADIKKVATELYRITEKEKRARGIR